MRSDERNHMSKAAKHAALSKQLPAPLPIDAGGRFSNPDRIVKDHAPGGEDDRESIDDKRGIEILQIARAKDDSRNKNARPQRRPCTGSYCVGGPNCGCREFCL